jgi:hypothetical protein
MIANASMVNWRQMAEKLTASVSVLENLLNATQRETIGLKTERSVALQFPEDFFQDQQTPYQLHFAGFHKEKSSDLVNGSIIKQIHHVKPYISVAEVQPESQLKLHQSMLNFKQFNCSLKPLLAMLEFVLQDGSG